MKYFFYLLPEGMINEMVKWKILYAMAAEKVVPGFIKMSSAGFGLL